MTMCNSLAKAHPELVSEWSVKNLPLTLKQKFTPMQLHGRLLSQYVNLFLLQM